MTLKTITIYPDADSYLNNATPDYNFGAGANIKVTKGTPVQHAIIRFKLPKFSGEITSQKLRLYMLWRDLFTIGVHIVKPPFDDLWIEGTEVAATTTSGCTWNVYAILAPWTTPGGDYDADPIGIINFNSSTPASGWVEIVIPIDNYKFKSNETVTLLLKPTTSTAPTAGTECRGRLSVDPEELQIIVDVEDYTTPILTAETLSSTQINLSWDKPNLSDENFVHYLLEQSDTGSGGWTTLATIADKEIVTYQHTGIVIQSNVNDYNSSADTYPNGRTKYYRLSIVTSGFGTTAYGTANATTIPAVRPIYFTFNPKSKYNDKDFIDDNKAYMPYGVQVIPNWYDENDTTEETYIDRVEINTYFRQISSWPGTPSVVNTMSPVDFTNGEIVEGDNGYKPYKIKGSIFDTGGLQRQATLDRTTAQFDVTFPAPCPIAIPDGDYAIAPPALLGRPFTPGQLIPVNLFTAGQQFGNDIFNEDFAGTPGDNGKWMWTIVGGASIPVYDTSGADPRMKWTHSGSASGLILNKRLLGQTSPSSIYDKYFSKYTGGYRWRTVFRMSGFSYQPGLSLMFRTTAWNTTSTLGSGYEIAFNPSLSTTMTINKRGNFLLDSALIASIVIGTDAPMYWLNDGKYIYIEIIVSPYFSPSGNGDVITIIYNIGATLAAARTINYNTTTHLYVVSCTNHNTLDQPHYTGRNAIYMFHTAGAPQSGALFEIYDSNISGRVNGKLYSAKNITTNKTLNSVSSPIPLFPISCQPDQVSQLCYIEGRIKNDYGAQSKTNVDKYQGDTFYNAIPIGVLSVPKVGFIGSSVTINCSQSVDPEGGNLIYKIDFGDGTTDILTNGIISHTYSTVGSKTIKLIVEDEAGLLSTEIQSTITIYSALGQFDELTPMSPWISISQNSPTGTSTNTLPEVDYDIVQTMPGGNRVFSLTGIHNSQDDTLTEAQRMVLSEAEKELFHWLKNHGNLITLDLVFFGKVRGVIIEHNPAMEVDDQSAFGFSLTFQEVAIEQFGE